MISKFRHAISTDVLSLPSEATTRSGFLFDPQEDCWIVPDTSKTAKFEFLRLRELISDEMLLYLKKLLLWYLQNRSVAHAFNMFYQFRLFAEFVGTGGKVLHLIDAHDLWNYKADLPENHKWYLGVLSGFLQRWHKFRYPGVADAAYHYLKQVTLKGNKKGWAVLTMDEEEGPLTEIELHVIHRAVNAAYASGRISNREFSLIWLLIATGARPVQIADLKIKDFRVGPPEYGGDGEANDEEEYIIHVPRAKQRSKPKRSEFKPRELRPDIAEVLQGWIEQVRVTGAKVAPNVDSEELPIFPEWGAMTAPGFEHHSEAMILGAEVKRVLSSLDVTSHRTGEKMKVTPRRFRYTLGTRAAVEKHSELLIAELLDHSDTQHVKVYVKAVPEVIEHLDRALADELAPLANAFAGKVAPAKDKKKCPPDRIIRNPKTDVRKGNVGKCGGCSSCGAMVPIACYVCEMFQAWVDAPHEEVLNQLIQEREEWLKETGDKRTAFANDHVILAVTQVVQMCNEIKEARI